MRVIDAHTGREVHVGDRIPLPGGQDYYEVLAIRPGLLSATMDAIMVLGGRKQIVRGAPLTVRWTHPGFFLQHVAFVPS